MGIFCYKVMPFGLKNVGATYQRLVSKMFKKLISKTVEVYVDDMIVKSKNLENHPKDIVEAFDIFDKVKMKMNPKKSMFGVKAEKLVGFLILEKGIEAKLEKIKAIMEMKPLRGIKEIQRLNRRIITLRCFMLCLVTKCLPFYKALKARKSFKWGEDYQVTFNELKIFFNKPSSIGLA